MHDLLHKYKPIQTHMNIMFDSPNNSALTLIIAMLNVFMCAGWGFSMGTEFQFHSWRVFVLVAALPAIASLVGLTFMPESPRFLLEVSPLSLPG